MLGILTKHVDLAIIPGLSQHECFLFFLFKIVDVVPLAHVHIE